MKANLNWDFFRQSLFISVLALRFGNIQAINVWHQKLVEAYEEIDLPSSRDFTSETYQVGHHLLRAFMLCRTLTSHTFQVYGLMCTAIPTLLMIGMEAEAYWLLRCFGFTWDNTGFENLDLFNTTHKAAYPPLIVHTHTTLYRLLIILASPDGTINEAEANAWIPSPSALVEMEKGDVTVQAWGCYDMCSFAARSFLRLGRDDDAYDLARFAVAPELGTLKKTTLVSCHSILGQVAARRGETDEAEGHFARALEEAKTSRLPMLEILAVRDWRDHLLAPTGRDCGEAEAVIEAACTAMNKTRGQLQRVLGDLW